MIHFVSILCEARIKVHSIYMDIPLFQCHLLKKTSVNLFQKSASCSFFVPLYANATVFRLLVALQ